MRSLLISSAVVAVLVFAATHATMVLNYRSAFNILWMIGIPVAVAFAVSKDDWRAISFDPPSYPLLFCDSADLRRVLPVLMVQLMTTHVFATRAFPRTS
jgi:hypothetical protein